MIMKRFLQTVVVGLSGGVDSSVAACLLKEQGYRVVGLHMKTENVETQKEDEERVRSLCSLLNIECVVVDYQNHMQLVKDYFIDEYKNGRTPNPCVVCNKEVKFKPFLEYLVELQADYFATGHYAIVKHENNVHKLSKAVDQGNYGNITSSQSDEPSCPSADDGTSASAADVCPQSGTLF